MKRAWLVLAAPLFALSVGGCDDDECGWSHGSAAYAGTSQLSATLVMDASSLDGGANASNDSDGSADADASNDSDASSDSDAGADASAAQNGLFVQATENANMSWNPNADQTGSDGTACDENGVPFTIDIGSCSMQGTVTSASYTSSDDNDNISFDWGSATIASGECQVGITGGSITLAISSGTVFWPDSSTVQIDVAGNVTALNGATVTGGYATYEFNGTAN